MNNGVYWLLAGLGAVACGGCAAISTSSLSGTTWSTDCGVGYGAGGVSTNYGERTLVTFTATQLTYVKIHYDVGTTNFKSGCQTEDVRVTYTYSYSLSNDNMGSEVFGMKNPKGIDLTLQSIAVLASTTDGVTYANAASAPYLNCSGQSFALNTSKDILADAGATTTNCYAWVGASTYIERVGLGNYTVDTATGVTSKVTSGSVLYQVMAIEETNDRQLLSFGSVSDSASDGQVSSRRPTFMNGYSITLVKR